jgi:ABC-2 type transport system ATP-binding protein
VGSLAKSGGKMILICNDKPLLIFPRIVLKKELKEEDLMIKLSSKSVLDVASVCKRFATTEAVNNLSFCLEEGEMICLLGPNGAGKTTVIRMLMDIIRPDSGTIRWWQNGQDHTIPDPTQIGYLPEERGLYLDVPVLKILVYLASIRGMDPQKARKAALDWLERMNLADRAGEKLNNLSKGNQQKVQFVAAILHKPSFVILDEPFSGLDPLNQDIFIQYIRELNEAGTTMIISAHQMQLVEKLAQKVLIMNRGQVVFLGTISKLLEKEGVSDKSGHRPALHDIFIKLVGEQA